MMLVLQLRWTRLIGGASWASTIESADSTGRPRWQTSLHTLQTPLVDQSAHSAAPAGGPVCTVCDPCWRTSLHSLQPLLVDQSAQSATPAGGPVCAVCAVCRWHSMPTTFFSDINMQLVYLLLDALFPVVSIV
jgi:hypothetical protein